MIDWNHVNTLLSVIHQAAAAGPKYDKIGAQANAELQAMLTQPEEPTLDPQTTPPPEDPTPLSQNSPTLVERRI